MVAKPSDAVLNGLKGKGFRLTKVRYALVDFILNQSGHWTIQELTERVQKKIPTVGQATVYRTVGLLHAQGALTESHFGGGIAHYEVSPQEHHDHLKCLDCGHIVEFENDQIEKLQEKVAKSLGFKLKDHRMELFGACQREFCKNKKLS